jgi:ABC-type oligopeptide transport system substrate-binding subunit
MKKLLTVLIVLTLLASSLCATGRSQGGTQETNQELSFVYSGEIISLNYYTHGMETTYARAAILLDGLVENNKYGVQIPNSRKMGKFPRRAYLDIHPSKRR